jgi:hypothetical protein
VLGWENYSQSSQWKLMCDLGLVVQWLHAFATISIGACFIRL